MKEVHKRKRGKGIVWMSVVLLYAILMTGCGSSGGLETISIESMDITQSGPKEMLEPEVSGAEHAEETSKDDNTSEQSRSQETEQPSETAAGNQTRENVRPAEEVSGGKSEESVQPSNAAAGDVFDGTVEEIGTSSIKASETYTEDLDDGGQIAVSPGNPDPADFVEVSYTDETVFIIRSTSDMGITHSDSAGSSKDLEIGRSLMATGTRDGNIFRAKEIVICHFS